MLLDLDRFKLVNDSLGHVAGDELLVSVGQRLESCLRPGDTVARLGGDEFMLLLEDVAGVDDARGVAERIQRALAVPLPLSGHDVIASASIGIAVGDGSITEPHELLRDADTAMYEAKSLGGGQLVSFDARMHDRAVERLELESALRSAIERGELMVYYQPIVDLAHAGRAGLRGARALASPLARLRRAHPLHPARRGDRPDRRDRRLGAHRGGRHRPGACRSCFRSSRRCPCT